MRPLGRSNLVGYQPAPVDRTVILTCKAYTNSKVNDLYSQTPSVSSMNSSSNISHAQGETSREIEKVHVDDNNNDVDTIEDAWKVVVARSPMLQVDKEKF